MGWGAAAALAWAEAQIVRVRPRAEVLDATRAGLGAGLVGHKLLAIGGVGELWAPAGQGTSGGGTPTRDLHHPHLNGLVSDDDGALVDDDGSAGGDGLAADADGSRCMTLSCSRCIKIA